MTDAKARILLWGISGSGKTTTLQMIHSKLQTNLRGELRREPTRLDPTIHYETLSINLGQIAGRESQIELVAVPGAPDQQMTRKQLLDGVEGLILVLDASPERIEANEEALTELRDSLDDYGRNLDEIPVVLQYNKRDIADPFQIEDFHRHTKLTQSAVFETIATSGHGVMATLTTISKHVVRARKSGTTQGADKPVSTIENPAPSNDDPNASSHEILEAAILAEADDGGAEDIAESVELELSSSPVQPDWNVAATGAPKPESIAAENLRVVSAGVAQVDNDGNVSLPIVLGDEDGHTRSMTLRLRLDSLLSDDDD